MATERQLVGFFIEKEEYGINILEVQEIIRDQEITSIPAAPDYMAGIISIRGKIIPVIALRKRFGLSGLTASDASRIVVVDIDDKTIGIQVDEVSEVMRIAEEAINPTPQMIVSQGKDYIEGIGKLSDNRLLIILNIKNMFSLDELSAIHKSVTKAPDLVKPAPAATEKPQKTSRTTPAGKETKAKTAKKATTTKKADKPKKKTAAKKKTIAKKTKK